MVILVPLGTVLFTYGAISEAIVTEIISGLFLTVSVVLQALIAVHTRRNTRKLEETHSAVVRSNQDNGKL